MVGFFSRRREIGILFGFGDFLLQEKLRHFSHKLSRLNFQLAMGLIEIRLNHFKIQEDSLLFSFLAHHQNL
tara:strand:- start:56532 stop:56744 length:213 start_codon:yes stop_codon:yes gene_type:complete